MQPINERELSDNREWLLNFQDKKWHTKTDGELRLHLGSGHLHLDNYINVDLYTEQADVKEDIRHLSFEPNSVNEIVCQHALEHLPVRDVYRALKHWFEIMAPGATIELGLPDLELCCQMFLEAPESARWSRFLWTLYGAQTDTEGFNIKQWTPRDDFPFSPGQVHMSGFSLGYFVRMMEDIGFRMINANNYDGFGTPSLFVYATKPQNVPAGILEQEVVIGTFTNRTNYIPAQWASAAKFLPQIPFVTRFHRGPINQGMALLREDFIASGKRYWAFLDDDIVFLNPDILKNALNTLVNGKYAAVSVYSTFDPEALSKPYDASDLVARDHKWATGYFILVASQKVGDILPDLNLPDPNTAVDTSYSVAIRAAGFNIGISPDYVYHVRKDTRAKPEVIQVTNDYLMRKWGKFYFDVAQYDGNVKEWGTGDNNG